MRIVRFHVNPVVPNTNAAVDVPGRVVNQALRNRPRMVPHHSSRPRVEREGIIRSGHEHHSIHDNWSDFKPSRVARMKNPFSAEPSQDCQE